MWGISSRGARIGGDRRGVRAHRIGLVRMTVRGPVEHAVVELDGELDFASAESLIEAVLELPHNVATIDVAGLTFVDSRGVRAIKRLCGALAERPGHRMPVIVGMTHDVSRTFALVERRMPALV